MSVYRRIASSRVAEEAGIETDHIERPTERRPGIIVQRYNTLIHIMGSIMAKVSEKRHQG